MPIYAYNGLVPVRKLVQKIPLYHSLVALTPTEALRSVTSKDGFGVYASSDTLFRGAVFGRDSLEVGEDLLLVKPKLVRTILLTLACLQGVETNQLTEEEPGKIVHEYRRAVVDGQPLDAESRQIFEQLANRWGGNAQELAYYGSVDATPLFVRLAAAYARLYGKEILAEMVRQRDDHSITLLAAVEDALDWLLLKLKASGSDFLEFKRLNPHGIDNQVWKDSKDFYIHADGRLANHDQPISSIEVQAVTYDALLAGRRLLPARSEELQAAADRLQRAVFGQLWLAEPVYFALGTDYNQAGELRLITTMTANPAEMLDSHIFDNLPPADKQKHLGGLIPNIMGSDFLTDGGIRSRALSESRLVDYWDYHGSFTSWPKETYDIAKGLRRQGFAKLAEELENRLLNVVQAVRAYPEFVYIDARGRVLGMAPRQRNHGEIVHVESSNHPEKTQAWTVSAVIAINASRRKLLKPKLQPQAAWQAELEKDVLTYIPHVRRLRSAKEIAARYPAYPYKIKSGFSS